jgi:hypothetical protein
MSEYRGSGTQQHGAGSQGGAGQQRGAGSQGGGQSEGLYEQAQGAVSDMASGASEMWDDAYEQGERYYRQGAQAVRNIDGTTVGTLLAAGAIGFGLAWLMYSPQSSWSQDMRGQRRVGQSGRDERGDRGRSRR